MKEFRIQKRFEVWAEKKVPAENLAQAVDIANKMGFTEMFRPQNQRVELIDWTELRGTGAQEDW